MKSTRIARHLFFTTLLYWSSVFYWIIIAFVGVISILQYTVVITRQSTLFAIVSVILFFLLGASFLLALTNIVSSCFLTKTMKHIVYIIMWTVLTLITGAVFSFALIQAVLAQGYGL